jgi:hypothetical protein
LDSVFSSGKVVTLTLDSPGGVRGRPPFIGRVSTDVGVGLQFYRAKKTAPDCSGAVDESVQSFN